MRIQPQDAVVTTGAEDWYTIQVPHGKRRIGMFDLGFCKDDVYLAAAGYRTATERAMFQEFLAQADFWPQVGLEEKEFLFDWYVLARYDYIYPNWIDSLIKHIVAHIPIGAWWDNLKKIPGLL